MGTDAEFDKLIREEIAHSEATRNEPIAELGHKRPTANNDSPSINLREYRAALDADDDGFVLHLSDGRTMTWGELRNG